MKRRSVIIALLVGVLLIWVFIPIFVKISKLKNQKLDLQVEIQRLAMRNLALDQELKQLKNDPVYVEYMARRTFGTAKEGEVIYKLVNPEEIDKSQQ
jgi:cell division protein FtsB